MSSPLKPIRVLQPGATLKAAEAPLRPFDGAPRQRYQYGKGRWRTMPDDRRSLRRQADKISELLGYVLAHLANMHEAYKGAAETHDEAILSMLAITEIAVELWDGVRRDL